MSFYATIQGQIQYKTQEAFDAAVKLLADGGWIDAEENMVDECGTPIDNGPCAPIDREHKVITFPLFHYRNLSRLLNSLFIGGEGQVIWTSTDGCFDGGVIENGSETYYNLRDWAAKEGLELVPEDTEDFDALCDNQQDIEQEFHASF